MSKKIMNKKIADYLRKETNEQRWERIKKAAEATDENPYVMLLQELKRDPEQFKAAKEKALQRASECIDQVNDEGMDDSSRINFWEAYHIIKQLAD